jgi:predicted RNA-binding Zn ribbon-like protein
VFKRAIQLREAIYRICKAILTKKQPEQPCLDVINKELRVARGVERLVSRKAGFGLKWDAPISALDRVLWFVTQSAVEWLTTGDLSRLRECRGEDCGWIFEDLSRNRSRQWCDMNDCGNLAKVRRFRLRQQRTQTSRHRPRIGGAD